MSRPHFAPTSPTTFKRYVVRAGRWVAEDATMVAWCVDGWDTRDTVGVRFDSGPDLWVSVDDFRRSTRD